MARRRVVRLETAETSTSLPSSPEKKQSDSWFFPTLWLAIKSVARCFWYFVRIIWYWLERIFLILLLLLLTIGLAWWLSQKPSLLRDWEPIDARLPDISWSGNMITIDNIRDNQWKTDIEHTERYTKDTFNLDDITGLYYVITPFSDKDGPAHTMFTFSFSGGKTIAISPEIRKERGESFDAVK